MQKAALCGWSARGSNRHITKTLLVMKLTMILLTVGFLNVHATGVSQNVSFSGKNVPLESVLLSLKKQTGFVFIYTDPVINAARPVTINAQDLPIEQFLSEVFKSQPLRYEIKNKNIIIFLKPSGENKIPPATDVPSPVPVAGRVLDTDGQPLAGASVLVKGSKNSTSTKADGVFNLNVVVGDVLVISYIGYQSAEYKITPSIVASSGQQPASGTAASFTIVLNKYESQLKEVVVNKGYYTEGKKFSTGNVSKVTAEEIANQPVSNVMQALSGRLPGMFIAQNSGEPGSPVTIQIRGRNSLRYDGNDPLLVIDGVPYPVTSFSSDLSVNAGALSPLQSLNPANIESVEVLKDADATAIYGSRGANGVILITTKKGKAGKLRIDINAYSGGGKVTRVPKLLNTKQYLEMRNEAFANDGATPQDYDYDVNGTWDSTRYTNWADLLIGNTAKMNDLQFSVSGGEQNTKFLVETGYHKETSVYPGEFSDEKLSTRFSLSSSSANKKLTAQFTGNYMYEKNVLSGSSLMNYIAMAPNAPAIYEAAGKLNWENDTFDNPFGSLLQRRTSKVNGLISSLELSYELLPGLFIKNRAGINLTNSDQIFLAPSAAMRPAFRFQNPNATTFVFAKNRTWIDEPQISYTTNIGDGKLDASIGSTFQSSISNSTYIKASGFASEDVMQNIGAAPLIELSSTSNTEYNYSALFGRIGYQFKERYIINLTGRRDGSSRFGPGKRIAQFGAVGAAWVFSSEPFFKSNAISFGKVRFSYGTSGSDQINDYGYMNLYNLTYSQYQGIKAIAAASLFNSDYSWESNKKLEAGLEMGLFNDRINLAASFYRNRSSNQLVGLPLPAITGFNSILFNLPATVQNTGFEGELKMQPIKREKISWELGFNISIPRNKLIAYPNIEGSTYANTYEVGRSLFIKKVYQASGVNQQTGIYTFEDIDGDGSVTSPADILPLVEWTQRYFGGLQNTVRLGNFNISIFIQFVNQSNQNYKAAYFFSMPGQSGYTTGNQPVEVLDRWRKPGDNTNTQRFSQAFGKEFDAYYRTQLYGSNTSTDASYLRLKNVSISYNLPKKWLEKAKITSARLYVQGHNLATITSYKVFDPETLSGNLPPLKMLTGGIQLSL